ncbi:MAG: permease of phosphate ABC transporter [Lachnospiraceae bacterium]|nr:permease of phosphate ABC transporter [Lachnospiraceae bacterium]
MDKLISMANQYVKESDWKVIAAIKMCLLSLGVMFGMAVPKKNKNIVFTFCLPVFMITYVPLIMKLFKIAKENEK